MSLSILQKCQHKYPLLSNSWYSLALSVFWSNKGSHYVPLRPLSILPTLIESSVDAGNETSISDNKPLKPISGLDPIIPNKSTNLHKETTMQCSGFKRYDGQRCKRIVNVDPTSPNTVAYCYDHGPFPRRKPRKSTKIKDMTEGTLPKTGISAIHTTKEEHNINQLFDCWDLWIAPSINSETKQQIIQEMKRPLSIGDRAGYIYAYSFENGPRASTDEFAYFKIGRTTDPHRRMYQISVKCNHVPKIIELFPSFPITADRSFMSTNLVTMSQTIKELPKCPATHRVERLILLELSSTHKKADFRCPECNELHREWICVRRLRHPNGSLMTDQELWSMQIRPTILHWIRFGVAASVLSKTEYKMMHNLESESK